MTTTKGDGFVMVDASTWKRYSEETPEGGEIVLVRYPEGYRLRYHGETVWKQPEPPREAWTGIEDDVRELEKLLS